MELIHTSAESAILNAQLNTAQYILRNIPIAFEPNEKTIQFSLTRIDDLPAGHRKMTHS